jgi:hypothetical protein
MLGLIAHSDSPACRELAGQLKLLETLRSIGPEMRSQLKADGMKRSIAWGKKNDRPAYVRQLRRCETLSREFREVQRDESCTRRVKCDRMELDAPLLFHARIPMKRFTEISFSIGSNRYSAKARSPMPTIEAIEAIREHGNRFDSLEVWWVPNDVLVERIPDPDPILVGVITTARDNYYYELHRWIDEDVELGWWSKEGY